MFSFLDNVIKARNEWLSKPYYHYPNPKFHPILSTTTKIKLNLNTNQQPLQNNI